jgi:hypothetical protein
MAEYAPSTSKRGICFREFYRTLIYPAVCIDGKWSPVDSSGVLVNLHGWDLKFIEISRDAIFEILKEKWPKEDSILEMSDEFCGQTIDFAIHKIDYTTGKANGRTVCESGESFYDGISKCHRRDYWTPEEAAVGLCELCDKKLARIFECITNHEAELAKTKEKNDLLKERFRNYKPKVTLTLKERVDEKLNGMTTEEIAKAIGV